MSDCCDIEIVEPGTLVVVSGGGGAGELLPAYPANGSISALRVVRVVAGQLTVCDAANVAHAGSAIGVTTQGLPNAVAHAPKRFGLLSDASWAWDTSKPVYGGVSGVLTQSLTGLVFAIEVAKVVSPDTIFIELQLEVRL